MSAKDVANAVADLLRKGDHGGAAAKYHADDVVSYEPMDGPMAEVRGKDAVAKKGEWWFANHEVHSGSIQGPYVNGDQFILYMSTDITVKQTGQRLQMNEMGFYTVKSDKIVEERFFYFEPNP